MRQQRLKGYLEFGNTGTHLNNGVIEGEFLRINSQGDHFTVWHETPNYSRNIGQGTIDREKGWYTIGEWECSQAVDVLDLFQHYLVGG